MSKRIHNSTTRRPVRRRDHTATLAAAATLEPLEPRWLMSATTGSDAELGGGLPMPSEHGPGCGCAGCQTIFDEHGELTVAAAITDDDGNLLPEFLYLADELDGFTALPEIDAEFQVSLEAAPGANGEGIGEVAAALDNIPVLHSNPGASVTILLDFDGHVESTWGAWSNVTTAVYDIDGDASSFSATEISRITEIWARVAEDFAPFDVNVTTVDPGGTFANKEALRVAIGGSASDWYGSGAGGVSYINSFTNGIANVAYVFENNLGNGNARYVAEAASHEAGHALGLRHQAEWNGNTMVAEYWTGENGWAPIMGVGYYQTQTTWHDGRNSSSQDQDDMAILAGSNNGFGYRDDDHGSSNGAATPVTIAGNGAFSVDGIVERTSDADVFRFNVSAGTFSVDVDVAQYGPNLDVVLELYNSSGQLVTSADPSSLDASITTSLSAGTYYLHVKSDGQYGSVGQYTVSGTASAGEGDGGDAQTEPEVTVTYSGGTITDGQGAAISFGSASQGANGPSVTFTVRNDGDATLALGSLAVPNGFTVTNGLSSALAPGASDTFTLRLDTSTTGTKSGTISFTTNDEDEPTFNFNVTGQVTGAADITVLYSGSNISDGASTPISFGTVAEDASAPTRTFTVRNDGEQTLSISALFAPSGFSITEGLPSTLAAGASDTFTVRMNTSTIGSFTGEVRIYSSDPDEALFNFAVSGEVTVAPDAYEDNDSKAQVDAADEGGVNSPNLGELIDRVRIEGLNLTDAADWFRFEMDGVGGADDFVRIDFDDSEGDLDLVVYASDGTTEVGRSTGVGDSESVSLNGASAGVYYVRVFGYNGATNPDYDLTIDPGVADTVFNSGKKASFVDATGAQVTVSIKGDGAGDVVLDDAGNIERIVLTGATASTKLVIGSTGEFTKVGDIVVTGSLSQIQGKNLQVNGDITVTGAVAKIQIGSMDAATQQTLSIGNAFGAADMQVQIGSVRNVDIVSSVGLKKLQIDSWIDNDGDADTITGTVIGTLKVNGDFAAGLNLSGGAGEAMKSAKIGGTVSGDWTIDAGDVKKLTIGAAGAGFSLTADGAINGIKSSGDMLGEITASAIKSIKSGGDIVIDLTLTGDPAWDPTIKSVKASGVIGAGTWTITGNVGAIKAASTDPGFDLQATGTVKAVKVNGDLAGSLTALDFGSVKAGDELTADLTATAPDASVEAIGRIKAGSTSATIDATGGIGKAKVDDWTAAAISAAWIDKLNVADELTVDLDLAGRPDDGYTLGVAKVGGELGEATWEIDGDVGTVKADSAAADFELNASGEVDTFDVADEPAPAFLLGEVLDAVVAQAAADLDALFGGDPDAPVALDGRVMRAL